MGTGQDAPPAGAVHEFVQLLAGWVPDDKLAAVRQTLAGGQPAAAAAAAVAMVAEHEVPLLALDIDVATSLGAQPGALEGVRPVASYPALPFWFSVLGPDESLEADDLDEVMAAAAQERSALIAGLWRVWRFPVDDPGPAHRVYVVQVPDGAVAPAVTGELQAALAGHGQAGVEVVALNVAPPPYQSAALEDAALLWAAPEDDDPDGDGPDGDVPSDDEPPFKIARVFDFAKPSTGPGFDPGHRVVTDVGERDRLLRYLTAGTAVLQTTARAQDILNPDAGQVVPTSFRTDGEWIWTDTVAYYLENHGLAPDEELTAHIDARWQAGDVHAETDDDTVVEAANFLLYPPAR